jgi:putative transposase
VTRFRFVDQERAVYPVNLLCRLLKVSRSGYYAWRQRPPSARRLADEVLAEQIRGFHLASRGTYGAPRIHADLADAGVRVGRKRVARIMRENGLEGVHRRGWRHGTTQRDLDARPAPDLLDRDFTATAPDQKWVADVTYVPTVQGWLYLAIVLDVFSRRIVGWSMDTHRKTQLVVDAVTMAVVNRGGRAAGVIHHSDQGGEYSSRDLELALRRHGLLASMGSVGDAYDNSMAEAFFATLETELFWRQPRRRFDSHRHARLEIFDYIETFYNRSRRHTSIGSIAPVEFELRHGITAGMAA